MFVRLFAIVFGTKRISEYDEGQQSKPWQLTLRKFFSRLWVEIAIGVLVVISVALTLLEFALEVGLQSGESASFPLLPNLTQTHLNWLIFFNAAITLVFVIELTLRYLAAGSKKRFFSEFWLDILATIPVFRVFRSARALRLLRLIRLVRLLGVFSRLSSHYPHIFRRGALEFLVICGFLFVSVLFGTAAMTYVERSTGLHNKQTTGGEEAVGDEAVVGNGEVSGDPEFTIEHSFWFSVYTLFAGEPIPSVPRTLTGKIVSVFLMFMGLTVFAVIAGTVSAFMSDRIRVEARVVEWDELSDHIVICGWTPKTETIIREFRAHRETRNTAVVIVSEVDAERVDHLAKEVSLVFFVDDDFTKVSALRRAGIERARTCLVLSDLTGGRSEQDADARTILAALTVEKINEQVYTCAELINREYSPHLELGKVNNFVVSEEYGAYMLAQASMHHGLASVMNELLSFQHGNEFYRAKVPESWIGKSFASMVGVLKTERDAILVGVHPYQGKMELNPVEYTFGANDEVVAICRGGLQLE